MAFWKILSLLATVSILIDAKRLHQKRDVYSNICDPMHNNTNKVQCYCVNDKKDPHLIANAECYLAHKNVPSEDRAWSDFKTLGHVPKLTLVNTKGIALTYIPTQALKETTEIKKLDVKYGMINMVTSFAFANLSLIEEITLSDNQIALLEPYAFANHENLKTIGLDTNSISEINRNVFVNLPSLQKLYLTNNQISTIHDRAFINLIHLKELEMDRNKIFSLDNAVFDGLKSLENLDLSGNALAVIGDNTFQALENLKTLNLDGNNIQMLDEKAFYGLGNMRTLTLAHNKLTDIDNDQVFVGLGSLMSLNLKANQLKQLKISVIQPILSHFFGNNSNLDVEDNNFPCDCRLDWFTSLMNKTTNKYLQITIENLKCTPDPTLKEAWTKADKTPPQATEDDETQQGNDYEYYDETQLNGKLFYVDVRDLLKCNNDGTFQVPTSVDTTPAPFTKENSITSTNPTTVIEKTTYGAEEVSHASIEDSQRTTEDGSTTQKAKSDKNRREKNDMTYKDSVTTTRLATVSAKPIETKIYENMASDEAKPETIRAHKSVQEEGISTRRMQESYHTSDSNINLSSALLILFAELFYLRLHI